MVIRGNTAGSGSGLFSAREATLIWRGRARPVSTRRIVVDHFNGTGGIPANWAQFEGQPGDVVEKPHNLTITDSAGNSAGIVSTAKTVPFNPVGVKTTIVARIKSLNANGSAIFGLIGLDAQNSPAGYLATGIDAHGNVFIASSITPTLQPTPKLIGAVKGYSGKSITLTFTIKSMGVEVEGGGFKSSLIPFKNLSNFSLAAAFPNGNARPALGATSLPNEQGGESDLRVDQRGHGVTNTRGRADPHPSSLIPHPSSLIPHPSSLIPHPSSLIHVNPETLEFLGRSCKVFGRRPFLLSNGDWRRHQGSLDHVWAKASVARRSPVRAAMMLRHSSASATDSRQQSAIEIVDPAFAGRSPAPALVRLFPRGFPPMAWSRLIRIGAGNERRKHGPDGVRGRLRLRPTVVALEGRTLLSTFTINSTADDGSTGTLRWAINQANQNGQANTITFSSLFNSPQTITLTGGTLELTDTAQTTITGPGANLLTLNGTDTAGNGHTVFEVSDGAMAELSGLTITGGDADGDDEGGGVYNDDSQLTMTDVVVRGNTAGGNGGSSVGGGLATLYGGTTTLSDCTISGNAVFGTGEFTGGGIYNGQTDTLIMTDCTISLNYNFRIGGGLTNAGKATLTDVTISSNSAGFGGGLVSSGTLAMTGCTVSGNSAAWREAA